MKQIYRKKKCSATLCAALCTVLLSGCFPDGDLDIKGKNEQLKDTILEAYDAFIGGAGTAVLTPERSLEGRLTKKMVIQELTERLILILQAQKFCSVAQPWNGRKEEPWS